MSTDSFESIELAGWEPPALPFHGLQRDPLTNKRTTWHPKLTPYRLLSLLLPAALNTAKAIATQRGLDNVPITLEWVCGVVVFILLFNTGTYECRPIQHVPTYLACLFKYDCMDAVWWLRSKVSLGSLTRPVYMSDEVEILRDGTICIVTPYRLLVCSTTVVFGMTKAGLTYRGVATGATWVDWILGVITSSALYVLGFYESNTIGLCSSFFGTNCAYVVRFGIGSAVLLCFFLVFLFFTMFWLLVTILSLPLPFFSRTTGAYVSTGVLITLCLLAVPWYASVLRNMLQEVPFRSSMPLRIRDWAQSLYLLPPITFMASNLPSTSTGFRRPTYNIRRLLLLMLSVLLIIGVIASAFWQAHLGTIGALTSAHSNAETAKFWWAFYFMCFAIGSTVILVPAVVTMVLTAHVMWQGA